VSVFDWVQTAVDVVVVLWIGLHGHPIYWRRR